MAQSLTRLTVLATTVLLAASMASGVRAQTDAKPRVPTTTMPSSGTATDRATRRTLPPPPAPSVDTNPNAGRGQSYYPPRATTGSPPR
jgi:hypothetical protein